MNCWTAIKLMTASRIGIAVLGTPAITVAKMIGLHSLLCLLYLLIVFT